MSFSAMAEPGALKSTIQFVTVSWLMWLKMLAIPGYRPSVALLIHGPQVPSNARARPVGGSSVPAMPLQQHT